jgi:hypothetical protein
VNWHRITVNLPPEYKKPIQDRAKSQNRNITGYVKNLIDADLRKTKDGVPATAAKKALGSD